MPQSALAATGSPDITDAGPSNAYKVSSAWVFTEVEVGVDDVQDTMADEAARPHESMGARNPLYEKFVGDGRLAFECVLDQVEQHRSVGDLVELIGANSIAKRGVIADAVSGLAALGGDGPGVDRWGFVTRWVVVSCGLRAK
jgi:hypothetical protein